MGLDSEEGYGEGYTIKEEIDISCFMYFSQLYTTELQRDGFTVKGIEINHIRQMLRTGRVRLIVANSG